MKLLPARSSKAAIAVLSVLGLSIMPVAASAAELQVLAGYAIAAPLQELASQFERISGERVVFRFGTAPQLVELIRDSASFDLIIVPSEVFSSSAARARLEPGSDTDVAHIGLAVAIRAGSRRPDISTPAKFREALLQARSIATVPASATGARITQTLDRLGILNAVRGKIQAQSTPAQVVAAVASGKAELALFLSNVLTAPGVDVVGPFPDGLQQDIIFRSSIALKTRQPQVAEDFLRYVRAPAAAKALRVHGVTPGGQ